MAAVVRVLEDLDARQVLVEALAVPARDALLRAVLWFSRSIATKSLRDGCLHAAAATATGASLHAAEAKPSYAPYTIGRCPRAA